MKPLPLRVYRPAGESPAQEAVLAYRTIAFVGICAILYFGRDILIPIVLAVLLAILLTPLVKGLQRIGLPKPVGVFVAIGLTIVIMTGTTFLVGSSLTNLASDLPTYESNLREKARSIRSAAGGSGAFDRAAGVLEDLQLEMEARAPGDRSGSKTEAKPIPVEVHDPQFGPLDPVVNVVKLVAHPLAQIGIMILILAFFLINREDLTSRLVRLAGTSDVHRTTIALEEAGARLSRLFVGQLAINLCTGAVLGIAFFLLGVPGALLWGLLTAVLRFVPFVGTLLSSILPIIIALAVADGWMLPIVVALTIVGAEIVAGNVLEPVFLGKMTGVSSTAIVVSAAFWSMLWGPVGLVLATPITVGLLVVGRHIDSLNFLQVLFGTDPVLSPEHAFYHRMLAGDAIEATTHAYQYTSEDNSLADYLEKVAVPGLLLASHDEQRGVLTREKSMQIAATFAETLEELWDEVEAVKGETPVALIANHGMLNFAATVALSALYRLRRIPHQMLPQDAIAPGRLSEIAADATSFVCLCSLTAPSRARLAYIERRVSAHFPEARVLHIAWNEGPDRDDVMNPAGAAALLPAAPHAGETEAA